MTAYCVNLERLSIQAHATAGAIASVQSTSVAVGGGGGCGENSTLATPGLDNVLSSLTGGIGGGGNEEYIVEAFLENVDKLEALVKTLLALEFWRENVLFFNNGCRNKNKNGVDSTVEEEEAEEVEFEIEGGKRDGNEYDEYNNLNEVDGGEEDDDVVAGTKNDIETKCLAHHIAANGNALRTAFILHAETTIVSLLSLIFYKGIPAGWLDNGSSTSGDEVLLSLVDYCARQLIFLGTPDESNPALSRQKHPLPTSQLSTYLQRRSRMDEIRDSMYDATFQTAITSVTLSRYLCENLDELGPSLLSRVMEVHDFPLLMVPLVEEPPWTRRRSIEMRDRRNNTTNSNSNNDVSTKMIWEKLNDHNEWKEVPPADLLLLTKLEGQPWLALFHLTISRICRESYGLDEYRKSQLMRLRKYIHKSLVDQLPVLEELARYLDELSILGVPPSGQGVHRPSSSASSSGLLLTRVDSLREGIVGKKERSMVRGDGAYWERVVRTQWEEIFSHVTDSTDVELRRIASEVYGGGMDDVMDGTSSSAGIQSDLKKEGPQSTGDDWRVALSKPIQKIMLHMEDGSDNILEAFDLFPVQHGRAAATTDTPLGPFRRIKMSISQTSGEGEAMSPHAKAVAHIHFHKDPSSSNDDDPIEIVLSIESLALPTVEHTTSQTSYDEVGIELPPKTFPSKEWRQLGDLEGKSVVLQLGFKRLSRGVVPAGSTFLKGYALSQAFLSQPVV